MLVGYITLPLYHSKLPCILGDSIFVGTSDRLFIWPAYFVGHTVNLPQVELQSSNFDNSKMVSLETLHVDPPIFRIKNFISDEEADQIIQGIN